MKDDIILVILFINFDDIVFTQADVRDIYGQKVNEEKFMGIYFTAKLIVEYRHRKKWQQEKLLEMMEGEYAPDIYRIESGELLPRGKSLKILLDALEIPLGELVCPHLEGQPMSVYDLRYRLPQLLEQGNLAESEILYRELEQTMNLEGGVNNQFLLCKKALIMELKGEPIDEMLKVVTEAISLTFEDFSDDSPGDAVLVFEEPELFHLLARLHARNHEVKKAIRMLRETVEAIYTPFVKETEANRQIAPMLITLTNFYTEISDYEEALRQCEKAIDHCALNTTRYYMPELCLLKAKLLYNLSRRDESKAQLVMAFAGFLLLGEREKALMVEKSALDEFGIVFKKYEMDKLYIPASKSLNFTREILPPCNTIGAFLREERERAGVSIRDLSRGICSAANLSKIENDEIATSIYVIEPLLQRLGRNTSYYCNHLLKEDDIIYRELKTKVQKLVSKNHADEAVPLVKIIKEKIKGKTKAELQFALRMEADIYITKNGSKDPNGERLLIEALNVTIPNFSESKIKSYLLCFNEATLINSLAGYYMENKQLTRAANIYAALLDNLKSNYVDESERTKLFGALAFNYTTCLGRLNRQNECFEVIERAEAFERDRGRLDLLPNFAGNKAYHLEKEGKKDESLSFFALAYYGFMMFENYDNVAFINITKNAALEKFGIEFE